MPAHPFRCSRARRSGLVFCKHWRALQLQKKRADFDVTSPRSHLSSWSMMRARPMSRKGTSKQLVCGIQVSKNWSAHTHTQHNAVGNQQISVLQVLHMSTVTRAMHEGYAGPSRQLKLRSLYNARARYRLQYLLSLRSLHRFNHTRPSPAPALQSPPCPRIRF